MDVSRPYLALLAGTGVAGAATTQLLWGRNVLPISEALTWSNWDGSTLAGAIAGMLVGHAAFILKDPKRRLSRVVVVCALANVAAWLLFLTFGERVTDAEFAHSAVERARLESGSGGLSFVTDAPTVIANRWVGTYGAVNSADRILTLFAGPAIGFSQAVVWPESSSHAQGVIATPAESWKVAATAFLLSTTFWLAVGSVVNQVRKRRAAVRHG